MALLEYPTPLELAAHLAELPTTGTKEEASAEAKTAAAKRLATTASAGGGTNQQTLRVLAAAVTFAVADVDAALALDLSGGRVLAGEDPGRAVAAAGGGLPAL